MPGVVFGLTQYRRLQGSRRRRSGQEGQVGRDRRFPPPGLPDQADPRVGCIFDECVSLRVLDEGGPVFVVEPDRGRGGPQ